MIKLKLRSQKKSKKEKPKPSVGKNTAGRGTKEESRKKEVVRTGYAKKGDLVAVVKPATAGKDGKNIYGESIPYKRVYEPRLISGENIRGDRGAYYMNTDGIVEVLQDETGAQYIRGRAYRFGQFKVRVSDHEMHVYMNVGPPIGGADSVSVEDVLTECRRQRIVFGVKKEEILRAIEKAEADRMTLNDVLIAEGEEAVDGKDGQIELKVKIASGNKFMICEDGSVDYNEQDLITNVEKGQLIAVVTRATGGQKEGHTVKGEIILAKRGHDVEISIGDNIREEKLEGSNRYYSLINGQLLTDGKRLSVEPILTINGDVGPQTGNINFDGIVMVKGNVNDNYHIKAKKSIIVHGNVGSATLNSDEDLTVMNGVVGKSRGRLSAGGNISVKFAENAVLRAGGDVNIRRAALNCKIIAGNRIVCTKEKGQIIGGELKARHGIDVKILGNDSEHKMDVFAGSDFFIEHKLRELSQERQKYENGYKKIMLLMDKLEKVRTGQGGLPEKLRRIFIDARKKKTLLGIAIGKLNEKEQEYLVKFNQIFDSEINVFETLYPGVRIYFGRNFYEPEQTKSRMKIYYNPEYEKVMYSKI
jgi:uncharacterized protein (DUF342 family)